jgi:polar amino acid transport system substrate-binding protein
MSVLGDTLRLACIDSDAPPLFTLAQPDGTRGGYEPDAAALVAAELGLPLEWVVLPWSQMIPAVQRGEAHGVWCGQGITAERQEQVDFTRPYAVFDESVLVRRGSGIKGQDDLRGQRVAAIAGSANMSLARTFTGAEIVPFDGGSDDVFADMLAALRSEEVDAVVDDDVVFVPLGQDPRYEQAFTVATRNRWAVGVSKERPEVREAIDAALAAVIADGRLGEVWRRWMPDLAYPFAAQESAGAPA